jgi:hypothetical protein
LGGTFGQSYSVLHPRAQITQINGVYVLSSEIQNYYIQAGSSLDFEFAYGTYPVSQSITLADGIISDDPTKVNVMPANTLTNFVQSISGNFALSGTAGAYYVNFTAIKTGTVADPIAVNDYLIFDNRVQSDFLRGAHRVVGSTAGSGNAFNVTVLNKYLGTTGATSISGSAHSVTGSIKVADVVFSLTGATASSIFVLNSPNKCMSFGMTGATANLDIVFTGWQIGSTGTGIRMSNGATVLLSDRVWFTDLNFGVYAEESSLYDYRGQFNI